MKKKTILLIILPILLIIIAAGTVAALYFMTDIFKSNQELFLTYVAQNKEILQVFQNENEEVQKQFKEQNTYQSTGNLDFSIPGVDNVSNIKLTTATRHDARLKRTYSEMALKQAENDVLKISYINSGVIHAIKADDIISNYIGIQNSNLKEFLNNMGLQEENSSAYTIPDSIDFATFDNLYELTDIQKQHLIDTYLKPMMAKIPEGQYSKLGKSQITVDNKTYTTNAYQLVIDTDMIKAMIIDCLTTLKSDNETLVLLSNKLSELGLGKEITDIANMANVLDKMIQAIQEEGASTNETISIIVYESEGKTIRTVIKQEEIEITIDNIKTNHTQKVDILIKGMLENNELQNSTLETNSNSQTQLTFQKTMSDESIVNEMILVPDANQPATQIIMDTTLGNIQNNAIQNMSKITIMVDSEENGVETISSSYTQNIQATNQIEEIPELNSTNTVIINHYTKEQLSPVFTNIGIRIMQVIPQKIAQLDINTQGNTNEIASVTQKALPIAIAFAGINIGNVNGMGMEKVLGGTVVMGTAMSLGLSIYNQADQVVENFGDMNNYEAEAYNVPFLSYEGEMRGASVIQLCNTVKEHNLNFESDVSNQIILQLSSASEINTEPTEKVSAESVDNVKKQISNGKKYIVDFGYAATGKIVAIGITEKQ